MISINQRVMGMVRQLIEQDEALGCRYFRLSNGTHVVDMGVEKNGGWEAARLFTEINMAGLGTCSLTDYQLDDELSVPAVQVFVDNPELACLVSQIAGLKLIDGEYAAIGSGPARALAAAADDHCFELTAYRDVSTSAVLGLQMTDLPDEGLAKIAARVCKVKTEDLYLLVHSSTSIVASVQVSARIVEQTINKMIKKGFDLSQIVMARGLCIVAPPVDDELAAMGKINDCLLYGGKSSFYVRSTDEEIERVLPLLVTESAKDYGRLFVDLFEEAGRNFYNMDLDIHSPAQVQIYNMSTGRMFSSGRIRRDIMKKSLFGG
jgi:methenyltetrahydromethanopterin cyclohydrolase